jgi:hypothetical protein
VREFIRHCQYIVTIHGEEEMENDNIGIFDVENAILEGNIYERQRVKTSGEWKYCIKGRSIDNRKLEVVAKISVTNKLVIITVYET